MQEEKYNLMQKTVCLEKNDKGADYAAGMEEQNPKSYERESAAFSV